MILKIGVATWHGPFTKGHSKCTKIKDTPDQVPLDDVSSCKTECTEVNCNAFTFDHAKQFCRLWRCPPSILALPDLDLIDLSSTGYLLLGNT